MTAVQVVTVVRRAGHLDSRLLDIESVCCTDVCFIIHDNQVRRQCCGQETSTGPLKSLKFKLRKAGQLALMRGIIAIVILASQDQTRASIFVLVETG